MARFNLYKMTEFEQKQLLNEFFVAVAALTTFTEVKDFLKDLLNPQETAMLARRLKAAQLLLKGKSYNEIAKQLKMAPNTIAKVHRWVEYKRGGYKAAIKRMEKVLNIEQEESRRIGKVRDYGWERMKRHTGGIGLHDLKYAAYEIGNVLKRKKRRASVRKQQK